MRMLRIKSSRVRVPADYTVTVVRNRVEFSGSYSLHDDELVVQSKWGKAHAKCGTAGALLIAQMLLRELIETAIQSGVIDL